MSQERKLAALLEQIPPAFRPALQEVIATLAGLDGRRHSQHVERPHPAHVRHLPPERHVRPARPPVGLSNTATGGN